MSVGLSALDLQDVNTLVRLAANPQSNGRGEIYLAIAKLYHLQGPRLSERERSLMREILQRLARDVEMAIRITLAERLADDDTVPAELILTLCDDDIEVARPLILRSRALSDNDLLELVKSADTQHQTACAERPNIGEPVTDALARSDSESVLVALLRNVTAQIAGPTFETLVEKSRRIEGIQAPLVQRRDLPTPLATRMCVWVSEELKTQIVKSFPISADQVAQKVSEASHAVVHGTPAGDPPDSARKLVEKLSAAGQLKAGFLLRVLHQGKADLFELAFAKLLDVTPERMNGFLYESGPRSVALACRAVGIDRCVFNTVFNLSRQGRGLRNLMTGEERKDVEAVFDSYTRSEAIARLTAH
ncbi:MAG: DUF2336 domain-containing protein [Alphaproteobacteria bacterium]|nr:DUF2336 domain-containing protein [Alphaproteobacteria bacterium]